MGGVCMIRIERYTSTLGDKEWLVVAGPIRNKRSIRSLPLRTFVRAPFRSLAALLNDGTTKLLGPPDFTWGEVWLFVFAVDFAAFGLVMLGRWLLGEA